MQRDEEISSCYFSFIPTDHLLLNLEKTSPIEEIGNAWRSAWTCLWSNLVLLGPRDGKKLQVLPH